MRHLFYFIFFLISVILMQSCNKNTALVTRQIVIDTALNAGIQYTLDLRPFGNTATITTQASSYSTSKISADPRLSILMYQYSSAAKTAATDQVILGVSSGKSTNNNCANSNADSTVIKINFTIK